MYYYLKYFDYVGRERHQRSVDHSPVHTVHENAGPDGVGDGFEFGLIVALASGARHLPSERGCEPVPNLLRHRVRLHFGKFVVLFSSQTSEAVDHRAHAYINTHTKLKPLAKQPYDLSIRSPRFESICRNIRIIIDNDRGVGGGSWTMMYFVITRPKIIARGQVVKCSHPSPSYPFYCYYA